MIKSLFLLGVIFLFSCRISVAQNETVTIHGFVKDSANHPVPNTNVGILNSETGTMTNDSGYFSIQVPAKRKVSLAFSYIGYLTEIKTISASEWNKKPLKITITPEIRSLREVQITGTEKKQGIEKINMRDFNQLPNPSGNIESIIKTLPGVVSNNELTSQYSVRGGSFDENLIYVNDIEIYRPFLMRSGQQEGLSFVNTQMTSSVKFSAGGFESRYGDKMSSVLDVTYKQPEKFQINASASLLSATLTCEGVSKNKKLSQITGVRYKTSKYLLKTFDTQGEYNPEFIDIQSLLGYKASSKLEFSFLGNLAQNVFDFVPESRSTNFGTFSDVYNLTIYFEGKEKDKYFSGVGAFTTIYKPTNNLHLKFICSGYTSTEKENFDILGEYYISQLDNSAGSETYRDSILNIGIGGMLSHARNTLWVDAFNFSHIGIYETGSHIIRWSAQMKRDILSDKRNEWTMFDSSGYVNPYYSDKVVVEDFVNAQNKLKSIHFTGYLQDTWQFETLNSRFSVNGGVRFHYWDYTGEFLVSPRGRITYQAINNINSTYYFATGLYYQTPTYPEMRLKDGTINGNIKSPKSIHFMIGNDYFLQLWGRPFKLTSEAYYKKMTNLIPYKQDNVRLIYSGENLAKGYAYGIDSKLNGEFIPGLESWLSLSFLSTKEDIKNDSYVNSSGVTVYPGYYRRPTDQRLTLNLFFQDYLPNNPTLQVHLNLVYGSGLPSSPTRSKRYDLIFPMGAYKRVDIGLSKILLRRDDKVLKDFVLGLEIFNLLGVNNKASYLWIRTVNNQDNLGNEVAVPNYLTGRRLNIKLSVKF